MRTDQAALILYRLDELKGDIGQLSKRFDKVEEKVDQNRIDTASLKIKSGLWGAMSGAIPAAGAAIYWLLKD